MANNLFKKLEDLFFEYTEKYDENIKKIINEKDIEISISELEEILDDAKKITVNKTNYTEV